MLASGVISMSCCLGETVQHRGIWLHPEQFKTRELADELIGRVAAARLNAIYPLVWCKGGTGWYRSNLCPMGEGVPDGFDPLGYLIEAAHARHIDVHAWFVNGHYGEAKPGFVFSRHPDWELQGGGRGADSTWYDLGKPEVRDFERDVMLGCLKDYNLDGIHFDYIRYSGHVVCRCEHCQNEFSEKYGFAPRPKGEDTFPVLLAVGSNPLGKPTTAKVLATFDSGVPAITMNQLGRGEAVLINWGAAMATCPAVDGFVRQMLARFGAGAKNTYQLNTTETAAKYRPEVQRAAHDWLAAMGFGTKIIDETSLQKIPADGTVVLIGQYLMGEETARWLEGFVGGGGHCLFVDGPVFAIKHDSLKRVVGLQQQARYFHGSTVIQPAPDQDVIKPGPPLDVEREKQRMAKWVEYRTWTVTELVRSVYRGAKKIKPGAHVSAAVFYKKASADGVCQDWYGWLKEGCIDYVLPMAYTEDNEELAKAFAEWKAADPKMERIIPGLSIYSRAGKGAVTRDIKLVDSQMGMGASNGARGNLFFCLRYLSDDLIGFLAGGPFAGAAKPYYPAKNAYDN